MLWGQQRRPCLAIKSCHQASGKFLAASNMTVDPQTKRESKQTALIILYNLLSLCQENVVGRLQLLVLLKHFFIMAVKVSKLLPRCALTDTCVLVLSRSPLWYRDTICTHIWAFRCSFFINCTCGNYVCRPFTWARRPLRPCELVVSGEERKCIFPAWCSLSHFTEPGAPILHSLAGPILANAQGELQKKKRKQGLLFLLLFL